MDQHSERVAALALAEGCQTDKAGVLDVLIRDGSFDVQACPGSGKTTTVAAKIIVLLDGWRSAGGICVLTHTNVAREEIERKLRKSASGRMVLERPHFVGTIQSFVDAFLATPYLRAEGTVVEQIDNDAFASAIEDEYRRDYHRFRAWLEKRTAPGKPEDTRYRALEYDASSGTLTFDGKPTGLKDKGSKTYVEMLRLKERVSSRGIFRHGDMYYFANRYLDEYPWAPTVLRQRFPVVIIDEMQDTSARQEALLERVFPADKVTVQRFGDENQKIFDMDSSDDEATSFPREPVVDLGESRRFGDFIARTISTIAPRAQKILGEGSIKEARHTIFLFDKGSVLEVIPRFAKLAAVELKDIEGTPVVKAIGNRRRSASGAFPHYLGDYVVGFVPDSGSSITGTEGLRLRVERAKLAMGADAFAGSRQVMTAIRVLIRRWSPTSAPYDVVRQMLQQPAHRRRLGETVLALLAAEEPDSGRWSELVRPLLELVEEAVAVPISSAAKTFAAWTEVDTERETFEQATSASDLTVPVSVQTIHSVKGENHEATLVLETQFHEHDVSMVLADLAQPRGLIKRLGSRAIMHHRRMFVAMSRPRRLLCLAAAAAHVDQATRTRLRAEAWHIVDLTDGGGGYEGPAGD